MTTVATKPSPARIKARTALTEGLKSRGAKRAEVDAALVEFDGRTSGPKPRYTAVAQSILDRFDADTPRKAPSKAAKKTAAVKQAESAPSAEVTQVDLTKPAVGVGQYVRQSRKVRRSGTTVTVFDTHHTDAPAGADGTDLLGRWYVLCEDHARGTNVKTYTEAWKAALDPASFCTVCARKA